MEKTKVQEKHHFIGCNICAIRPIIGTRYKCLTCPRYDLCHECKEKNHHQQHQMVRKNAPGGINFIRSMLIFVWGTVVLTSLN